MTQKLKEKKLATLKKKRKRKKEKWKSKSLINRWKEAQREREKRKIKKTLILLPKNLKQLRFCMIKFEESEDNMIKSLIKFLLKILIIISKM